MARSRFRRAVLAWPVRRSAGRIPCGILAMLLLMASLVLGLPSTWLPETGFRAVGPAHAQTVTYIYDELGRLVAVVDPGGDTAVYRYDAVGNLLSIQRYASSTVSIIEFTPDRGNVGTTVTISGTGFSSTPSQNTVTFNGVAATVTSSTTTQIVTTVPTGATTGPIAVTAPGGSATSSTPFTVGGVAGAPTITGFSPAIATAGSTTTITGTNFDTTPANDKVKFNKRRFAAVSAATATSLTVTVPTVGSGKVSVTTPGGTATSTADFFVPPAPFAAADVQATNRIASGGVSRTITISTAGKIGMVVFDATAGQGISVQISSVTIPWGYYPIYGPDGDLLVQDVSGLGTDGGYRSIPSPPLTGTYTILVDPSGTNTGSATLKAGAADLVVTALTATGPIGTNRDGTYTIPITYTVRNQGNLPTPWPDWTDRAYLSTNTTLDAGDLSLHYYPRYGGLANGATYNGSMNGYSFTANPGTYYVIVKTDDANNVVESNNNNNTRASGALTLLAPPDLTPTALTVPGSPIARNPDGTYTIPVSYTVANQGASAAQGPWNDRVFLSADTTWDAGDAQIGYAQEPGPLASGTSYTRSPSLVTSSTQPAGTYYVILRTDHDAYLVESNETNNTRVSVAVTLLP